jgi:predicted double-glycine peptidase
MSYILIMLLMAILPLKLGQLWAAKNHGVGPFRRTTAFIIAFLAMGVWFGFSVLARRYSETDRLGWVVAESWAQTGKWYCFGVVGLFFLGVASHHEQSPHRLSRIAVCSIAVLFLMWITVWRTIPIFAFLPRTETRDETGCIRQTVPYTCGPVSLANLLEHYGMKNEWTTERELARLSGTTWEGTTTSGLIRAARKNGLKVVACRQMTLDELERQTKPAIVFISTIPTVRHAVLYLKSNGQTVETMDPDRGDIWTARQRFKEILYGKALVLAKP